MEVRRLLKIIAAGSFLALIAFGLFIYISLTNYHKSLQKEATATEIALQTYQRRLVADDYIAYQSERAKVQWQEKQSQIVQLVDKNAPSFHSSTEQTLLSSIKKGLRESSVTFSDLLDLYDKQANGSINNRALTDTKNRFSSQLSIKAQETVSAAAALQAINHNQAEYTFAVIVLSFIGALALFTAILLASFLLLLRSAKQLGLQKAQAEAILGGIGDGVFATNADGNIIVHNKMAEVLTRIPRHTAIGKPYGEIFHFVNEQTGEKVDQFIGATLSGKQQNMPAHTLLKRMDGTTLPVADSAAPILDVNGKITGTVIVFRDITRERQLEKLKDEFVSVASHELRTPMGAIRALSTMILDGDYGPVNKELVDPITDIKTSTLRLVNLVNDMLSVARIEAGRMKFTLSVFDASKELHAVATSLAPLGKEKGIAITCEATAPVMVQADCDKINQVATNLVSNALKFTDKGSITVSTHVKDDAVEVDVIDTGIGIAPEDQAKLFGKFEQITSIQGGRPQGTGLGLYISREIIRKLGGELWIKQSLPDKGSTFAFTIPLTNSKAAHDAKVRIDAETQFHPDQI